MISSLTSKSVELWRVEQVIVLDWYDGPQMGFCEMRYPECSFYFELFAQQSSQNDLDNRLFRIKEIPLSTMREILLMMAELGEPKKPLWIPKWEFDSEIAKSGVEKQIEQIIKKSQETKILIQTQDMNKFQGYWLRI